MGANMTYGDESNGCVLPERTSERASNASARPEIAAVRRYELFRNLALAGITFALIGLCYLLAVPFLPAITWAVALAIIAWPLHRWISHHIRRPMLAALLSAAMVVMLVVVPTILVTVQLAREASDIAQQVQQESAENVLKNKVADAPVLGRIVSWMEEMDIEIEAEARKTISRYTQDTFGLAQGSFAAIMQFLVAIFILYYLFLDRGTFMRGLRDLLPLSTQESDKVFARAADSVHANLYATFSTSLISSTCGGLMFWSLGLPNPVLWAVVMLVLSILPVLGTAIIWVPAVIYLFLTDQWRSGAILLGWGITNAILVDTLLYFRFVGQRMRMHSVLSLVGFFGGIAVFGLSGMILGPAIIAVTMALLDVWRERLANAVDNPQIEQTDPIGVRSRVT